MTQHHDPRAIIQAIRLIVAEGNVTELRALEATIAGDRWPATYSGYFDDPEQLAKAVGTIKTAKGIYFVPNPTEPRADGAGVQSHPQSPERGIDAGQQHPPTALVVDRYRCATTIGDIRN